MKLTNNGMARVYKLYTFLAYIIPMIVLYIIKNKDFSSGGSIFGFWGILVLMLCVIAFKNFLVEFFKNYGLLTVSLVFLIIGIFSDFIASELVVIGMVSVAASIVSLIFSVVADIYDEHAFKTVDGEKQRNTAPAIPQKQAWREAYFYNFTTEETEETENTEE